MTPEVTPEVAAEVAATKLRIALDALRSIAERKKSGLQGHPPHCLCSIHICRRAVAAVDRVGAQEPPSQHDNN